MTGTATTTAKVNSVCLICLKRFGRVTVSSENGDDNIGVIAPYQSRMLVPYTGLEQAASHDDDDNGDKQGNNCNDLYTRFLLLTSRYLKVPASETLLALAKQHKSTTGEDIQAFCDQCRSLIGYVCDLYAELQTVKLHLLGKVEELEKITRQSVKSVSLKLSRGLFKTVAEQLNIKSVRQLELFRKSVIINCNRKRKASAPQVLIPRGLFPEQWKFTYAATKQTLMRLIVIFALVALSTDKKVEKKRPEGILKTKGTLKARTQRKVAFEDVVDDHFFEDDVKPKRKKVDTAGVDEWNDDENDGDFPDTGGDDNDSDWSTGGASPTASVDSAGSDVNLNSDADDYAVASRKRRKRSKTSSQRLASGRVKVICEEDGEEVDDDDSANEDPDFTTSAGKQNRGRFQTRSSSTSKKDATIPCKLCKKLLVDRRGLAKHLRDIHNTHLDYNCDICGLKCKTAAERNTHKRQLHPGYSSDGVCFKNANLSCPKCTRKFVNTQGLSNHMLGAHNSRLEYICSICGHKSKSAADRMAHKSKMHKGGFGNNPRKRGIRILRREFSTSCLLCNKQFNSKTEFFRHNKEVHSKNNNNPNSSSFECPVCMQKFMSEERFKRHLIYHEQASSILRVFHCEVCGKSLFSEDALSQHFVTVHQGSYSCSMCDAKYPASSYLRIHLETHETDEKNYFCNFCFRGYTNEQYWQIHRKVAHVGKERIFCDEDQCAEEFNVVQELNEHLKKHIEEQRTKDATEKDPQNGEATNDSTKVEEISKNEKDPSQGDKTEQDGDDKYKIFTCATCGWGFLNKYHLTLHELVHIPYEKEIGYCCRKDDCNKRFPVKEKLITHYNNTHGEKDKSYECHECNHKFGNFFWFKIHLQLHRERKSGKKFICDVCNVECLDSISLCTHKRSHKPDRKGTGALAEYRVRKKRRRTRNDEDEDAPSRGRGRPRLPRTEKQMKQAEKYNNVPCEICHTTCESAISLRRHMDKEHEQVPDDQKCIQCNFCYLKFVHKQSHQLHMLAVHTQRYKFVCDAERCDETFLNHVDLNNHLTKVHLEVSEEQVGQQEINGGGSAAAAPSNPVPVKVKIIVYCKICTWGFVNPDLLELHQLTHIPPVARIQYPCPGCGNIFPSTTKLVSHYNTEHGKKLRPFRCLECPRKFFTKYGLRLHIVRHDRKRNMSMDEKFVCIECGRGFNDIYILNRHRKEHDPANHVPCPEEGCGQVFMTKLQLSVHLKRKHGQGDRFPCPICGASFIDEYKTKLHIEWTHGPPQFECDVCHKKYKRPGSLRRHKRSHDPEANATETFMCAECGGQYKSEEGLKYHVASIHTPEHLKRFSCPHCPYKVHRTGLFKMHLRVCLRNKGIPYDEKKWGKLPKVVKQQYTGARRKLGRKPGWKNKKDEVEDEMEEKSTTEDEEEEEEGKPDVSGAPQQQQQLQTGAPSSSTANVINAIIANLTSLPEVGTLTEQNHESIATRRGRRGNAKQQSKNSTVTANMSSSTVFPSTVDQSLFQSISQQQPLLPHQMSNHPQLFGGTNVPIFQNWLNATSAATGPSTTSTATSSFPHSFQHHTSHTPPTTQHDQQQHQSGMYSPDNVYSPPNQPQNVQYGTRK